MSAGRVSLAYRDLTEIPPSIMAELAKSCKILDLTSNQFSDLYPLRDLVGLEELILDDNKITSHTKFPSLPKLQNLWVNRNGITSLTFFIDKIVASYPDLIMLSMLNNEACPNYFNSGTPAEYQDYRYYVIHRLTKLQLLDSTPVSPQERAEAHKKYAAMASTSEAEATRRASEKATQAKKRAERERREQEKSDELVKQRQEEKKNRRRKKPTAAPSVPSPPKSPLPKPETSTRESHSENSGLAELPDINPEQNSAADGARVRVFPPLPPKPSAPSNEPDISHLELPDPNQPPTPQDGEWDLADDGDDDWSDSE